MFWHVEVHFGHGCFLEVRYISAKCVRASTTIRTALLKISPNTRRLRRDNPDAIFLTIAHVAIHNLWKKFMLIWFIWFIHGVGGARRDVEKVENGEIMAFTQSYRQPRSIYLKYKEADAGIWLAGVLLANFAFFFHFISNGVLPLCADYWRNCNVAPVPFLKYSHQVIMSISQNT